MIPPDEPPTEYTRPASPPYLERVYFTIWTMAPVSPPPPCLRDRAEPGIPTVLPGGFGKDHDEAVAVGNRYQARHLTVGARAPFPGNDGGRRRWEAWPPAVRDVDVHVDVAGEAADSRPQSLWFTFCNDAARAGEREQPQGERREGEQGGGGDGTKAAARAARSSFRPRSSNEFSSRVGCRDVVHPAHGPAEECRTELHASTFSRWRTRSDCDVSASGAFENATATAGVHAGERWYPSGSAAFSICAA